MRQNSGEEKGARSKTTQRGDEVGRLVILTSIGLNLPLTAGWGPEWRFDLGNSRALRRKTHPILNSYQESWE